MTTLTGENSENSENGDNSDNGDKGENRNYTDNGDNGDNSDNSDRRDNSDNSENSDKSNKSDNGDNGDNSDNSVLGRRRVGECSILQSSCCKSSPGRSETSDATGLLAVGFSLFSWRREITRRRRIFCPTSKPMSAKPCSVIVAKNVLEVTYSLRQK